MKLKIRECMYKMANRNQQETIKVEIILEYWLSGEAVLPSQSPNC